MKQTIKRSIGFVFSPGKSRPAPPASSPSSLIYGYPIATYRQRPHISLEPHGVLPILQLPACISCFSSALSLLRGLFHSSSFTDSHNCPNQQEYNPGCCLHCSLKHCVGLRMRYQAQEGGAGPGAL